MHNYERLVQELKGDLSAERRLRQHAEGNSRELRKQLLIHEEELTELKYKANTRYETFNAELVNSKLTDELNRTLANNRELERTVDGLEHDAETRDNAMNEWASAVSFIEDKLQDLTTENERLKNDITEYMKDLHKVSQEKETVSLQYQDLTREVETLNNKNKTANHFKIEIGKLKQVNSEIIRQNQSLKEELGNTDRERGHLLRSISSQNQEMQELSGNITKLEEEKEQLKSCLNSYVGCLQAKLDVAEANNETSQRGKDLSIPSLHDQLSHLKEKNFSLETELQVAYAQNDELKNQLNHMKTQSELGNFTESSPFPLREESETKHTQQRIKEFTAEIATLNKDRDILQETLSTLNRQLSETVYALKQKNYVTSQLNEQSAYLRNRVLALESELGYSHRLSGDQELESLSHSAEQSNFQEKFVSLKRKVFEEIEYISRWRESFTDPDDSHKLFTVIQRLSSLIAQ